jgi:hypothetical protein
MQGIILRSFSRSSKVMRPSVAEANASLLEAFSSILEAPPKNATDSVKKNFGSIRRVNSLVRARQFDITPAKSALQGTMYLQPKTGHRFSVGEVQLHCSVSLSPKVVLLNRLIFPKNCYLPFTNILHH